MTLKVRVSQPVNYTNLKVAGCILTESLGSVTPPFTPDIQTSIVFHIYQKII